MPWFSSYVLIFVLLSLLCECYGYKVRLGNIDSGSCFCYLLSQIVPFHGVVYAMFFSIELKLLSLILGR